jgi:hypothetical protein
MLYYGYEVNNRSQGVDLIRTNDIEMPPLHSVKVLGWFFYACNTVVSMQIFYHVLFVLTTHINTNFQAEKALNPLNVQRVQCFFFVPWTFSKFGWQHHHFKHCKTLEIPYFMRLKQQIVST